MSKEKTGYENAKEMALATGLTYREATIILQRWLNPEAEPEIDRRYTQRRNKRPRRVKPSTEGQE